MTMSLHNRIIIAVHTLMLECESDEAIHREFEIQETKDPRTYADPAAECISCNCSGSVFLIGLSKHAGRIWIWCAPCEEEMDGGCIIPSWSTWYDACAHAGIILLADDFQESLITISDAILAYIETFD